MSESFGWGRWKKFGTVFGGGTQFCYFKNLWKLEIFSKIPLYIIMWNNFEDLSEKSNASLKSHFSQAIWVKWKSWYIMARQMALMAKLPERHRKFHFLIKHNNSLYF